MISLPQQLNGLHCDTNNIVAKGDVWTKTHVPLKSSANKKHKYSTFVKIRYLIRGNGNVPSSEKLFSPFVLTSAGTHSRIKDQGHLGAPTADKVEP